MFASPRRFSHQEPAQRFERFVESHYPYRRFVEPSGIDAQQSRRFFQKGGLELEIRYHCFDLLPLALEGPTRGNKQRRGFGQGSVLGTFGLESNRFFQAGPAPKAKMVELARYVQFPNRGRFPHQHPQAPKLHTIIRLPYGARHGTCTNDASVPTGHPAALITLAGAIGHHCHTARASDVTSCKTTIVIVPGGDRPIHRLTPCTNQEASIGRH
jgi:hypothetical protein